MSEAADPRIQQVRNLIDKGYEALRRGSPEVTHQYFWDAHRLAESSQDDSAIGSAWLALADNAMHYFPGDVEISPLDLRVDYCEQALERFRVCDDRQGISDCLRMLAVADDPALKEHRLAESLRIAREVKFHKGIANTLCTMAGTAAIRSADSEAIELLHEAMDHAELAQDDCCLYRVHGLFGLVLEDTAERRAHFEVNLEMNRHHGWTDSELRCLMCLETLGCDPDDLDRREAYLGEALPLARQLGQGSLLRVVLSSLAEIAQKRGNETLAKQLETEADEASPPIEASPEFLEAIENGDVHGVINSVLAEHDDQDQSLDG